MIALIIGGKRIQEANLKQRREKERERIKGKREGRKRELGRFGSRMKHIARDHTKEKKNRMGNLVFYRLGGGKTEIKF